MAAPRTVAAASLPRLAVRLTDAAREFLAGAALANRSVFVPLPEAPQPEQVHRLEVTSPGKAEPLVLLAKVVGPKSATGYPLELRFPPAANHKATDILEEVSDDDLVEVSPHSTSQQKQTAKDPLIGRKLAGGKLVIEALVGQGGAGSVYRARHRDLHMSVAVKVMHESYQRDADFCRRFQTEALSASRLDHPNLTRVLDFGQEPDGLLYIAMEYLDGQSLRDILDVAKKLPLTRVASLLIQVCSGLTHAHARNVVHRDIKPENLMVVRGLDDDGKESELVKVCDFGIAHLPSAEGRAVLAGTAEYMAPELFLDGDPDAQSDVYACGVVLYELLTGVMPIPGDFVQIVARVQVVEPEPPSRHVPGLDARVDRLVLKALNKRKEGRHPSVVALRNDLRALAEISIFSAGGYWNEIDAAPVSARPDPASATAEDGAGADWLERGPGYLHSLSPSAPPVSTSRPAEPLPPPSSRAPLSASLMPSMRSPAPSYSSFDSGSLPPPSSQRPPLRTSSPSITGMPAVNAIRPPAPSYSSIHDPRTGPRDNELMLGSSSMAPPPQSDKADEARAMATFLRQLMDTRDDVKFAAAVPKIDAKIRPLMAEAQSGTLWRLRCTLDMIAAEGSKRAPYAQQLLGTLSDQSLLGPLAEKALAGFEDREGTASKLIARAGKRGAYALYAARLKHSTFEPRERFVTILQDMGAGSMTTIAAALERLESRLSHPGATALAEDLLKALPAIQDEPTAKIVSRYARSEVVSLALAATAALPKVGAAQARPVLLGLFDHPDDGVAIAAIKGLRSLDMIDMQAIRTLEPLVLGELSSRMPPRIAAVEALAKARAESLPAARALLTRVLAQTTAATPDAEDLVVVTSTALIAVGGDAGLVAARWRRSTVWLKTRLETVLKSAPKGTL
jgi:serine/threonine-protein kinase